MSLSMVPVVEGGCGSLGVDWEDVLGSLDGAATMDEDRGRGDDMVVLRVDDVLDVVWERDVLCSERADPPLLYIGVFAFNLYFVTE